jgi:Glucose-6-phosphate isomerase
MIEVQKTVWNEVHCVINVDISNIWGEYSLIDLLALEKEAFNAHKTLIDGKGAGSDFLGWLDLPVFEATDEMRRIVAAAKRIREHSDIFVVVGIGGSYLGPRAAIELVRGQNHNLRGKDPQVFFAGNNLSTRAWQELCALLEGKDFSINIISKSGTTTEPAIATRALKWMLERRYGADEARKRIFVTTDPAKGALRQMATEEGYEAFVIPPTVGGRYSVLTAVGLLPMAVAGMDITELMFGAAAAKRDLDLLSFENPAWLYAAARNLLYRRGKAIELLCNWEPSARYLGGWWQQLFGESEGKDGKGLFPATAEFTADLHSLGQMIQQGERNLFETVIRFAPPRKRTMIELDWKNLDGLNYLEGKSLDFVEEQAFQGTLAAHVDGGVPVILVQADEVCDRTLGELFFFFEFACGISAYMLGVNPFNQPGVEFYKRNMFQLLGKPGYEMK